MSDNPGNPNSNNRRRRNNNRRPRSGSNTTYSARPNLPRHQAPEQTGFQKFLSIVTFGLLGKPQPKLPAVQRTSSYKPQTENRSAANGSQPKTAREPRPRREPAEANPASITTERLYVGNLSYDASESDLFELFNGVGSVRNAEVVVNSRTQRSKGFAFLTMASVEEARRAVAELNGKEFMGRALQLSGAKPMNAERQPNSAASDDTAESDMNQAVAA
jgi:RNA recognition motif. (a.k.a. RRM, RBD, or RNP domain)